MTITLWVMAVLLVILAIPAGLKAWRQWRKGG